MKKRIVSLLLAVLMVTGTFPVQVFAADENISVELESSETTPCDICGNEVCTCESTGEEGEQTEEPEQPEEPVEEEKYAVFNPDFGTFTVRNDVTTEDDYVFFIEDFEENTIVYIADYYFDSNNDAVWYQVEFYSGGVVEEYKDLWPAGSWVLYNYTVDGYETDALLFVERCEICGEPGCETEHVKCEVCGEYDCEKEHVKCEVCGEYDCEKEHVPSISATVTDSNGNEQTVTVSGEALPEGATLTAYEAISELDGGFAYDIKILDADGNEWQPESGEKVSLSVPVPGVEDGAYIELIHALEEWDAIRQADAAGRVLSEDWVTSAFPDAASAYADVFGENGVAIEVFTPTVQGGRATVNTSSFSIYTWNGSAFSATDTGGSKKIVFNSTTTTDSMAGNTYYVTAGHEIYCDRGGTAASSRQWRYSSGAPLTANNELEGAHGAEIKFTVASGTATGTTFYIENRIYWWGWKDWKRVNFVVVEGRPIDFYNGSTKIASDTVITDGDSQKDPIAWPSSPSKTGCNFVGWSTTNGSTTTIDTGSWYPLTKTTTNLYAVFNYNVTYNLNGGSGTSTTQTAFDNTNVTLYGTPTRSGYTFLGWYSSVDGAIYSGSTTYTQRKNTTMTALWGKNADNETWNKNFYVLPGTTTFSEHLKKIDGATYTGSIGRPDIVADSNTYYVVPGTTMTFERTNGSWRVDSSKTGITTVGTSWTNSDTVTVSVNGSAAEGTTLMLYSKNITGTTVNCARIIVATEEDVTTKAINDAQNIYRVGLYIICDSTDIPGEPNYTSGVSMINVNGGMNYKANGIGTVKPDIAGSAFYINSLDGSCTMGVVSYTGKETIPFIDESLLNAAMDRVIEELANASGATMTAADGKNLRELYNANGADYIRTNYAVRPHIVKLMTGLSYTELGWHIDCTIYPLKTITLTYNLNPPAGYVLKNQTGFDGTPAPSVYTGDSDTTDFTVTNSIIANTKIKASVSGATDEAELTFTGWNTKPDGTGTSYAPGGTVTTSADVTLYAQWTGGQFTTGTLKISKKVTVASDSMQPNSGEKFTFTVTELSGGTYNYKKYNSSSGALVSSGTTTNGTFELQDGQFVEFAGVPVQKYTVEETLPENYTNANATQTLTLRGGYVNELTFNNVFNKRPNFNITFNFNGGTNATSIYTVTYGSTNYYEVNWLNPNRTGYSFAGWFNAKTGGTQVYTKEGYCISGAYWNSDNKWIGTSDLTVYAHWTANTYTVTFDPNGENAAVDPKNKTVTYDAQYGELPVPTRAGYHFDGWFTGAEGGTQVTAETKYTIAGNSTLYAHWSVNQYTITFDTDGGSAVAPITQDYNTAVTAPADPTKEGYTFAGWDVSVPGTMPAEDMTITAKWTINQYTITFDTVGGTKIDPIKQNYGTAVTAPANPTKTGYTFAGWDTEVPATMPAGDMTITAKWTINQYTITFDTDGGSDVAPITQDYNTAVTAPNPPTKTGYTFAGWDKTIPDNMPAEDMTVKAQWTANKDTPYKVQHWQQNIDAEDVENGVNFTLADTDNLTGTTDTEVTPEVKDYTGFKAPDTQPVTIAADGSTVVNYYYIRNEYEITWLNDDDSVIDTTTVDHGEVPTHADPSKAATAEFTYTFTGWTPTVVAATGNAEYKATYSSTTNVYTVTWKNEDGTVLETDENVPYGTMPSYNGATPVKTGDAQYSYTFKGWDPEKVAVIGNTTYTAVFEQVTNKYTMSGSIANGTVSDPMTVDYGTNAHLVFKANEGYEMIAWDIITSKGTEERTFTNPSGGPWNYGIQPLKEDTTIKVYTAPIEYTITYNGLEGAVIGENPATYTIESDDITLKNPTKVGYTFAGWTGTGLSKATKNVTISQGSTDNREYTANWTINQYTITFDTDGGTAIAPIKQDYNTAVTAPANPTKTGYTFAGWDKTIPNTMPAEDMTITANWTANDDTEYKVKHWQQNIGAEDEHNDTNFTLKETDELIGTTATKVTPVVKNYDGFTAPETQTVEIAADGSTVVNYYYTRNQYTLSFEWATPAHGDSIYPSNSVTKHYGENITLEYITKIGYKITGTEVNGQESTNSNVVMRETYKVEPITENIHVIAYTAPIDFTINYKLNGGMMSGGSTDDEQYIYTIEQQVTLMQEPTKTGYKFTGWKLINVEGGYGNWDEGTFPAGETFEEKYGFVTFEAQWEVNQYTITFDTDGGTAIAPITQDYNTAVTKPADPTKEGYTFAGWDVSVPATMPAGDMTITAQWTINQYTITFDTVGGTAIDAITQDYNTAVIAPADPTKTGYTFAGWDKEIPETMPAENMTITAQWTVNSYTIEYDLDEGNWTEGASKPESYTVEDTLTVTDPARPGYKFVGWVVSSSDGDVDNWSESYTNITGLTEMYGNVKLTAQWERSLVDLTIKTKSDNSEQSFIFTVTGTPSDESYGTVTLEVVLVGTDEITIKDLPVGIYTVTEKDGWSWRESTVGSIEADITTGSKTVEFVFGTVDNVYWLSGYSYNKRRKGRGQ